jgi:hypothetical protein
MHSNSGLSLSQRFSTALQDRDVASLEVGEGHIITLGKLKDGGTLVTSTLVDPKDGSVQIASLELSEDGLLSADLHRANWSVEGCTAHEQHTVDQETMARFLPPLPKLSE